MVRSPPGGRPSKLLRVAAVLTVLAMLPTVLAVGARHWWVLELATHFRVQYAVVLGFGAVAWALARALWLALACGVLAIVSAALVLPIYFGSAQSAAGPGEWRILSANVHRDNREHRRFLKYVRREDPDLLLLLEVDDRWARDLADLHEDYPFYHEEPRPDNFGIACYSRLPARFEVRHFGGSEVPSIVAHVEAGTRRVTVFGTHALPPMQGRYADDRNRQLLGIAQVAADTFGPVLLIGDFNMTNWSPWFAELLRRSGLRDSRQGFGLHATWPGGKRLLRIPIDHVLVSPGVRVHDRRLGPPLGSDHLPVVVDISVD